MDKYDVKKAHKQLYSGGKDFTIIEVPTQQFIQVDGRGDPNTAPEYVRAVEALYGVAYTVKFAGKAQGRDFVVAPLEGLWWAPAPSVFTALEKDAWNWTMMISQPEWVTPAMVADACGKAAAKRPNEAIAKVRLRSLTEGRSVQILHLGPYRDEAPTLARLHDEYMPANGLHFNGKHHEIYLSDPRRTPEAGLKTLLRQPVTDR